MGRGPPFPRAAGTRYHQRPSPPGRPMTHLLAVLALSVPHLDQLGDPCREIIELRYFGDLEYEEIGRALNLNPKTVSSRLSRCLDRLQEIVRPVLAREKSAPFSV